MIRVLFLAANPAGTSHLALDEEIRAIDAKIQGGRHRDLVDLKPHWAVRLDDLSGLLMRHQPHVIHFSGHGAKAGDIVLQDTRGTTEGPRRHLTATPAASERGKPPGEVPPGVLANLLSVLKDNVRVVVLNACYSAAQAKAIVKHIDCAVGMSDEINDDHAIAFAAEFYQALAFGRSVKAAFDLGVVRLKNEGFADAGKLVKLHTRRGAKAAEVILIGEPPAHPQ